MKHGQSDLGAKRPRYHPVIAWENQNLTNDFVDINRVALDDRYGKNGASLYKRRNGQGPTKGETPGLFGMIDYESKNSAFNSGLITAAAVYGIVDLYLNRGHDLAGLQRRLARWPLGLIGLGVVYLAIAPSQ